MRDAVDIFSGRYVLLVSDDKERTLLLSRSLRQSKAKVGIRRADRPAPPAGTELVLVDVRHGPLNEAEKTLLADPRLRLASVCAVDFRSVVTERGSVRTGLLEDMVVPLVARDRALTEQARREPAFVYELASLGPVRTLRALSRAGGTFHVAIEVPDPPVVRGSVTVSGELIVSAFLESAEWREEGLPALARMIELRHGRLAVSRVTHPQFMNVMESLDVALSHAHGGGSMPKVKPSLAPPPRPSTAAVDADWDAPVLLVRRRPPRPLSPRIVVPEVSVAPEADDLSDPPDITQVVHSCELQLDAPLPASASDAAAAPVFSDGFQTEKMSPLSLPEAISVLEADAAFAGPRTDAQMPTPVLRAAPKRSMLSATLGLVAVLGAGGLFLDREILATLPHVEQLLPGERAEAPMAPRPVADAVAHAASGEPTPHAGQGASASITSSASEPHAAEATPSDAVQEPSDQNAVPAVATEESSADVAQVVATATSSKELVDAAAKLLASQPAAAKRLCEAAIALDGRNPHAYAGLGQALIALAQPAEAQKALENAVRLRSRRAMYRLLLGDALRMAGKLDEARAAWRKARDLDPSDDAARESVRGVDQDHG